MEFYDVLELCDFCEFVFFLSFGEFVNFVCFGVFVNCLNRGEEKEGSSLDGEGDGDEPRCALKTAGQPGWRARGRAIPEIWG